MDAGSGHSPETLGTEQVAVRPRLLVLILLASFLMGCGGGGATPLPPGGAGTTEDASLGELGWAEEVLDLTNAVRAEHGLAPLLLDERATAAAYEHAWDMHQRDYFAHVNPEGEGPSERLTRHEVVYRDARENLARGHASPQEVLQGWMDSPTHRANLLYAGWTHIGVAVHSGPSGGPWWVQEFYR